MKYTIYNVGGFYEIFDNSQMETVFVTTSKSVAKTALYQLNKTGKISNRLIGGNS